ncbi:DEAD-box ATP-dependent RNA helicase FANCM isoform X3 [Syzygium oleosum]|uniref:DEAD-box ATP-dependent RNA helicase FANCM isoform X3 n=1 Tax=Syzygium oleosum TaxID=219896 RepID=UPI0024B992E5|nr:DEAD-box ATP-dependent RNA helicase FANCM isoform X3 [Syzygium oleosum]
MASTAPHIVIDDEEDDDFDWDAAVREIDAACESSRPPAASDPFKTPRVALAPLGNAELLRVFGKKSNGVARQSTLDSFVGRSLVRTEPGNLAIRGGEQARVDCDDAASCVEIDPEAAKTWIYPVNVPLRDYQFSITKTALFSNTLVALPTGLGKTLIAAVVMFNYFRWFPEGKIVFTAPSRPLVIQQIEACHNVVGIPQEWTIDMTGQMSPDKRVHFWKSKRVFFVTPQVLEKDIQSGTCLMRHLVCLVIDEAHRAMGNYSYCVVVRELIARAVHLRILALTATPGSKHQTIQHVIDNLIISTLEYRNESDPDVSQYVHDRKLELIEVAMGKEAIEINDLLLNVIRIYAARLNAMGILLNRDYQALSPSDLLNSRDKFRQAPPPELPQLKYGEVERFFGALITLYHIRKLLSSHGIRPAYEMLEEKLHQGSFASLMSRNEDINKAKLIMQQSLSRGAPNPKLSKMLEVLIDHFRKSLKGQSQKVQQAVLEKFRAGGYNVIVATSIGEEGLDIMEVDLVICFDANVSPLRMIQRMGRTGRKHDGRVVVLACEGSELKGYRRKQANSKAVSKHMRNGGIASFNFHLSPRMIPHIFKPDVQFVELSIEKFVPRGKKVKDDDVVEKPMWKKNLTVKESDIIAKYFNNSGNKWRPSLIAFPHFQTFPCRVHIVMHSCRTSVMIDAMQHLQGVLFSRDKDGLSVEEKECLAEQHGSKSVEQHNDGGQDLLNFDDCPDIHKQRSISDTPVQTSETADRRCLSAIASKTSTVHSYLFNSDFVSVDNLGNVLILSVPSLPSTKVTQSDDIYLKCPKKDSSRFLDAAQRSEEVCMPFGGSVQRASAQTGCLKSETQSLSTVFDFDAQHNMKNTEIENLIGVLPDGGEGTNGTPEALKVKEPFPLASGSNDEEEDTELSPRLSNYMESGVVPESPVKGESNGKDKSAFVIPDLVSPPIFCGNHLFMSSSQGKKKELTKEFDSCRGIVSGSPTYNRMLTPSANIKDSSNESKCGHASPDNQMTPENNINSSRSKNWCLTPNSNSNSVKGRKKLRRLRRVGDCARRQDLNHKDNCIVPTVESDGSFPGANTFQNQNNSYQGEKKTTNNARAYIEEEAEVSSGAEASDDEEDDLDRDTYEDSFIDDGTNPTAASTQDITCTVDMMAVYRHSLLSQSPNGWRMSESTSSSGKSLHSLYAPGSKLKNQSEGESAESLSKGHERIPKRMPSTASCSTTDGGSDVERLKRKSRFCDPRSVTAINLEREFLSQEDTRNEEPVRQNQANGVPADCDLFSDDHFYEGVDLDAVEAQATLLLQRTSECFKEKKEMIPKPSDGYLGSPTFDLGI